MAGFAASLSDILDDFSREFYDSRDPFAKKLYEDNKRKQNFSFGIVTDNRDPDRKGRIRVSLPMVAQGYITTWIPVAHSYAGDGYGIWCLPDINDQVFVIFLRGDILKPICIGSMYTPRHRPPVADNPDNNIKAIKTKKTFSLIDDTPGEERIETSIKDGKIRVVIDREGIHLINELGPINMDARKVMVEGGAVGVVADKDVIIEAEGDIRLKTNKSFELKASKDITMKGSSIAIKGSTGVTAEDKQIAKKDDPVAGMDLHDIMVPSNSGLTKVPAVPHPYIGKMNDKLSSDVNIMDKPAATKGSKCEVTSPGHFPMPPGVKFAGNPNNKGEVTNGCVDSVTINGKAVAVLGSAVTTCDDAGMKDQCSILAVGTTVTFPIQYPGQDPEQYKRDGGLPVNVSRPAVYSAEETAYADQPKSLSGLQWSESQVQKGTEVTLSCATSGVKDGANVMFSIFPEGADPEADPPVMELRGKNEGGRAEVKWVARDIRKPEDEGAMKWFFTAWTLYCA
ncbi:MAG: hypothetical protein JXA95_05645, partial [Spirochaetales bacterium]|nr:hypothetical protein [Spirochaetales bacterium]